MTISIILKVTEKCNSNCAYCDVALKKSSAKHMSLEVLKRVFERVNEYLETHPAGEVSIIWHGGEPLLLGPEYYSAAHELQLKYCPTTLNRITHCMQSNLTLFTEDHARVLQKLGIEHVGTSYDPYPHIRGPGSPCNSERYNRQFMRGDALAQQHGLGSGIIYVVTKKSLRKPLDVFYFLTNLRPGGGFSMNPVLIYDNRRDDLSVTTEEYVAFLGEIFPVWWEHRSRYPNVSPFSPITRTIKDGERSLGCAESGRCSLTHVNINPIGGLSLCGRSNDWGLLSYGNINDHSLDEVLADPQRTELLRRNDILSAGECKDCRFWSVCHGGCPLDAYPEHSGFMYKSEWACARKSFIEDYFEPITGIRFSRDG